MRIGSVVAVLALAVGFSACGGAPVDESDVDQSAPELTSCVPITATNSQHVTAGRAYTKQTTFLFFRFTTYFANGTNENLGTVAGARTTLYQIAPGVYSNNAKECPSGGGTGGATGSGGSVSTGGSGGTGGTGGTGGNTHNAG